MLTTYLTSTLTGVISAVALRGWPDGWQRSTGILIAAVTGAALGVLTALWSPRWAAAVVPIPIAVVLAGSLAATRRKLSS